MRHLSEDQILDYVRGACEPAELLSLDDHLAGCEACRRRSAGLVGVGAGVSALKGAVLPAESHLTDDQVAEEARGALAGPARGPVAAHLAACPVCAREVDELRAFARQAPAARRWIGYPAAAAAVLLALFIPAVLLWRTPSGAGGRTSPFLAGLEGLPDAQRDRVAAALQAGVAQPPPDLTELRGRRETLMGGSQREPFQLLEPVGTVVAMDRPTFRWSALPDADAYTVTVSDDRLRPVDQSAPVAVTAWTPQRPLPRGRSYTWQVTARRREELVTAPAPPAPSARFRVLDAETASRLDALAREHPGSHLLLGILYAQAGLVPEARDRLLRVDPQDRHFDVARNTLGWLQAPVPDRP